MHIPKSYQLIQRLSSSVTILVMILSLLTGTVSTVRAEGTHPGVLFDVHTNMAYANGWPLGATVTLKIDDSENGTGWDFTAAQGTTNGYTVFTTHPPFQIKAGQAVEISTIDPTFKGLRILE